MGNPSTDHQSCSFHAIECEMITSVLFLTWKIDSSRQAVATHLPKLIGNRGSFAFKDFQNLTRLYHFFVRHLFDI